ncbi:MAG: MBL fold metallo-hydrolase [bacterium]|nr:MBL fold metallo-hydrolase [bacterium]
MKLTFHGGVGMVTGANYLLESGDQKILIDCGLFQGNNVFEELNFKPFPYDPKEIAAVFITHSHIDHIGRLPKLYKDGFRGPVFSTAPAKDFAEFLLSDSEHILQEESESKNLPDIYGKEEINGIMNLWQTVEYRQPFKIGVFEIEYYDAGHVLGSASVMISVEGKKIIFSGDLGNVPAPLIKATDYPPVADYALMETTYGNRIHEQSAKRKDLLEDLIEETARNNGVLMIPAFALERTQELLFELNELIENGRVPSMPVFVDSPLAIKLTAVYQKYSGDAKYFNHEAINLVKNGDQIFNFPGLRMTLTTEQSKEINSAPSPKIVIAGAGMSNGGRILHHELRYLSDPKSAILFIGYQAEGSLGRKILDGAPMVRIMGQEVAVRCKIRVIDGYSAHADQPQLLKWLETMRFSLRKVFLVQGEKKEINPLQEKIRDELAIETEAPSLGQTVVI